MRALRILVAIVLLAGLFAFPALPAVAAPRESHVWFYNQTTDGWAWVTEKHYEHACTPSIIPGALVHCSGVTAWGHSWCVAPGDTIKRGFPYDVYIVRVEVSRSGNCVPPLVFDRWLPFNMTDKFQTIVRYVLMGHGGHYYYVDKGAP